MGCLNSWGSLVADSSGCLMFIVVCVNLQSPLSFESVLQCTALEYQGCFRTCKTNVQLCTLNIEQMCIMPARRIPKDVASACVSVQKQHHPVCSVPLQNLFLSTLQYLVWIITVHCFRHMATITVSLSNLQILRYLCVSGLSVRCVTVRVYRQSLSDCNWWRW